MSTAVRLAIDIGGTFTDLAAYDASSGEVILTKSSTTPSELTDAIVTCIDKARVQLGEVELFIHGSTIGINTIVERKGPPIALVTTRGFRDVYEMGRRNRPDIYDLLFHRPRPLIPRDLVYEVTERLDASGAVLVPLAEDDVVSIVDHLRERGIASVAVCTLHSYANPEHERRVGQMLSECLPNLSVSLSSDINREYREYERTSTAAMNAYLRPVVGQYLQRLEGRLESLGFAGRTLIMQSSGGNMTLSAAARQPVRIIESGPAGGVAGALWLCAELATENVIAFDMGGTTAKACLIQNGEATVTSDYYVGGRVEGHPAQVPFLDIIEIGAGGGSIATVDTVGALKVGPRSAGAEPGPASYGLGGTDATVTDANLVVGKIDPTRFLGGEMPLDVDLAIDAIDRLGTRLGLSTLDTANGILRIANAVMAQAVSKVSVQRGFDPRDFTMIAYGGAGPMHAAAVARELGIRNVVIPHAPGQFSALGMLTTDIRYDYAQTMPVALHSLDPTILESRYRELERTARRDLEADVGSNVVTFVRSADMRYLGQFHTITVTLPSNGTELEDLNALDDRFHTAHEVAYGHSAPGEATELISLRLAAFVPVKKPAIPVIAAGDGLPPTAARLGERPVLWEDGTETMTPFYQREGLFAGNAIEGPAIIQEAASVIPIAPGDSARVDRLGNIDIAIGGR